MPRRLLVIGVLLALAPPTIATGAEPDHASHARHGVHADHGRATHRPARHRRELVRHEAARREPARVGAAAGAASVAAGVAAAGVTTAAKPPPPPKPPVGSSTGLPIPRFAALRADEVNMRAGPGTQYPIQWVFKHQDMPVEIEREFDVWRLVEAPDGTKGWVHQATLIGSRTFFVPDGSAPVALRQAPAPEASITARLEPGVIGRLLRCSAGSPWCLVTVRGVQGYVARDLIWGLLPDETVGTGS